MSKRDRFGDAAPYLIVLIGLIFIFFAAASVFALKGYQRSKKEHESEYASQNARDRHYEDCLKLLTADEIRNCARNLPGSSRDDKRSEEDLNAQREMANWAESMLWATIVSIFVTIVGTVFVAFNLFEARKTTAAAIRSASSADQSIVEMKKATEISRESLVKNDRAWLAPLIRLESPSISENCLFITFMVSANNFGSTPAISVSIAFDYFNGFDKSEDRLRKILEISQTTASRAGIVYPNNPSISFGNTFRIPLDEINRFHPFLNVSIRYKIIGSDHERVTLEGYEIGGEGPGGMVPLGIAIEKENFRLSVGRTGFGYAT